MGRLTPVKFDSAAWCQLGWVTGSTMAMVMAMMVSVERGDELSALSCFSSCLVETSSLKMG